MMAWDGIVALTADPLAAAGQTDTKHTCLKKEKKL
jgi:hypothetical protein